MSFTASSWHEVSVQLDIYNSHVLCYSKCFHVSNLHWFFRYRVISPPIHGRLSVADRLLSTNDSFLHKFIEQAIVRYDHDGSEFPQVSVFDCAHCTVLSTAAVEVVSFNSF